MNRRDIEQLYTDNLISAEQCDAILAQLKARNTPPAKAPERDLILTLGTVAALLFLGGAAVLITSHWQEITPFMKTTGSIVFMVLAWIGCGLLQKRKPNLAEVLGLVGAGMWGVNNLLIHILYEADTSLLTSFFIFFVGLAPIPFLMRQRILIGGVMLCSYILLHLMLTSSDSVWMSLAAFVISAQTGSILLLYTSLMIFWWVVGERCRSSHGICSGYGWISHLSFLALLGTAQLYLLYISADDLSTSPVAWVAILLVLALAILLPPKDFPRLPWSMLALATCALVPISVLMGEDRNIWQDMLGFLTCSAYAIFLLLLGMKYARPAWVNYSAILMLFIVANMLYHIASSAEESGLILMTSGIALLALTFLLEGQRRRIIMNMNSTPADTPDQPAPAAAPAQEPAQEPAAAPDQAPAQEPAAEQATTGPDTASSTPTEP